ncbi:MAG TPA: S-methyl-5-thioribose-1-phosphate isomerase [Leptolyngbyaceae cyanobacterium M65_K2018_010]|nr:S-methyl-5-thioribose-1-phosphate isomerase [Leptolyngbyaceae cyanobacterium M65_K2018_010]
MVVSADTHVYPVLWQTDHLVLIDQRQLPERYHIVSIHRWEDVLQALQSGIVQGGSALGLAAAYGLYLAAREMPTEDPGVLWERLTTLGEQFKQTRPDKANLQWAVEQMLGLGHHPEAPVDSLRQQLLEQAQAMQAEDFRRCHAIGDYGLSQLPGQPQQLTLFTHCNHGALATSGYGTSLGVVRSAWREGRLARVYAGETRPTLQGSRLTAWECVQEGIPVTVVTDSMAAHCMQQGLIHGVLVGADRIAANGDVISKVGTYSLAVVAKAHGIPFLVAAPVSTIDFRIAAGQDMALSQHDPQEIYRLGERMTSPQGADFYNPASDLTPAHLITAIVTEQGAFAPDQLASLEVG